MLTIYKNENPIPIKTEKIKEILFFDESQKWQDGIIVLSEKDFDIKIGDRIKLQYQKPAMQLGIFSVKNIFKKTETKEIQASSLLSAKSLEHQTRSFEMISIKNLLNQLASEINMQANTSIDIIFSYLLQQNESNISFVQRISQTFGYHFVIKNKSLILLEKKTMATRNIDASQILSFSQNQNKTTSYNSAKVYFWDYLIGKNVYFHAGKENPTIVKEIAKCTNNEALLQAKALLKQSKETSGFLEIENTPIFAGEKIYIHNKEVFVKRSVFSFFRHGEDSFRVSAEFIA